MITEIYVKNMLDRTAGWCYSEKEINPSKLVGIKNSGRTRIWNDCLMMAGTQEET